MILSGQVTFYAQIHSIEFVSCAQNVLSPAFSLMLYATELYQTDLTEKVVYKILALHATYVYYNLYKYKGHEVYS